MSTVANRVAPSLHCSVDDVIWQRNVGLVMTQLLVELRKDGVDVEDAGSVKQSERHRLKQLLSTENKRRIVAHLRPQADAILAQKGKSSG